MSDLNHTFSALAEPTRRAVVERLRHAPQRAGDLAETLAVSRPSMSRHLKVLREAGLVEAEGLEDDARGRVYRLRPEPLRDLQAWLGEVQAFWHEQLAAFQVHAERRRR